jgi:hypothetical protein
MKYAFITLLFGLVIGSGVTYALTIPSVGTGPTGGTTTTITQMITALKPQRPISSDSFEFATAIPPVLTLDAYPYYRAVEILNSWGYKITLSQLGVRSSVDALISGQVQVSQSTVNEQLPAIAAGTTTVLFTGGVATDYILVTKSTIRSMKDLEGKIAAASSQGSDSYVLLKYMMEQAGIDVSKVKWSFVGGSSARMAALAAGSVDGALLYPDNAINVVAVTGGALHMLASLADYTPVLVPDGWWATASFVQDHPDVALDVARAMSLALLEPYIDPNGYVDRGMKAIVTGGLGFEPGQLIGNVTAYRELLDIFLRDRIFQLETDKRGIDFTEGILVASGTLKEYIPMGRFVNSKFLLQANQEIWQLWNPVPSSSPWGVFAQTADVRYLPAPAVPSAL